MFEIIFGNVKVNDIWMEQSSRETKLFSFTTHTFTNKLKLVLNENLSSGHKLISPQLISTHNCFIHIIRLNYYFEVSISKSLAKRAAQN